MLDEIVTNCTVYDGTGRPPDRVNVGWASGKIAYIGPHVAASKLVTDGTGKWLIPGLIDIHTHYDIELELSPRLNESLRHGVTTVVIGNCSLSLSLGEPAQLAETFERVESIPGDLIKSWLVDAKPRTSTADYLQILKELRLGPNVAPLVGHSCLRSYAMGLDASLERDASDAELKRMEDLLELAFQEGFSGLSVDRVPWHLMSGTHAGAKLPSHRAPEKEIRRLANVCRKYDRVLQIAPNAHDRASIVRLLQMATLPGQKPLRMSAIGALDLDSMPHAWRLWKPLLFFLNKILGGNTRLQTITAPFGIFSDGPVTPVFDEFASGRRLNDCLDAAGRRLLLADSVFRKDFRDDWTSREIKTCPRQFDEIKIVNARKPTWIGQTVASVAKAEGYADHLEFFLDCLLHEDTNFQWWTEFANRRLSKRQRLIAGQYITPGLSDAGAHVRNFAYYDFGLRCIKEWHRAAITKQPVPMPMEQLIAKLTGDIAAWWGLPGGIVGVGRPADLCLLDPAQLDMCQSTMIEKNDPTLMGFRRFVNRGLEPSVARMWVNGTAVTESSASGSTGMVLRSKQKQEHPDFLIGSAQLKHNFTSYWPVFVLKHKNPVNIILHCLAVILMTVVFAASFYYKSLALLLLIPLTQALGLLGHIFFERDTKIVARDAVFSVRALYCLYRMVFEVVTARYPRSVRRYESELHGHFDVIASREACGHS